MPAPIGRRCRAHPLLLGGFRCLEICRGCQSPNRKFYRKYKNSATPPSSNPDKGDQTMPCRTRLVADIVDHIAAIPDTSGDGMIMVCCHHEMQSVWYLADGSILPFNLEGVGGDRRLELIRGLVIASPQYLLREDKTHGFDPIVEPSKQAVAVINKRPCGPKILSMTTPSVLFPVPCLRLLSTIMVPDAYPGFCTAQASQRMRYLNLALSPRQMIFRICRRRRRCFCHPLRGSTPNPRHRLNSSGSVMPPGLKTIFRSWRRGFSFQNFSTVGLADPLTADEDIGNVELELFRRGKR